MFFVCTFSNMYTFAKVSEVNLITGESEHARAEIMRGGRFQHKFLLVGDAGDGGPR